MCQTQLYVDYLIADARDFFKQQQDPLVQEIGKRSAALSRNASVVDLELNLPDVLPLLYA